MSDQEVMRNVQIAQQIIEEEVQRRHPADVGPQGSLDFERTAVADSALADATLQSTDVEGVKALTPVGLSVLQACWQGFAKQTGLDEQSSREQFKETKKNLEKRGLLSVDDFWKARDHRWPPKIPQDLIDKIREKAQKELASSAIVSTRQNYKRPRIDGTNMEVDGTSCDKNVQSSRDGRSGSSSDQPCLDVDMAARADTRAHIPLSELELMGIHLVDAIVQNKGLIEERRRKYMAKWSSTFVGAFLIHPPEVTAGTRNSEKLRRIHPFEFFLWSNITPQPTIDYIKKRIAQATQTKTGDFTIETAWGAKLPYNVVAKDAYEDLSKNLTQSSTTMLENKPLVDLRIVAK